MSVPEIVRGVVHFHAIIRLDGPPVDEDLYPAPLVDVDSTWLGDLIREAVTSVELQPPPVSQTAPGHLLRFGTQVEARPVHRRAGRDDLSGAIHPETVAAYIAKYSTKSATDLDPGARPTKHHLARIRSTVFRLSELADHTYRPDYPSWQTLTGSWGNGRTCSGSAATSLPSPAATPLPSAGSDPPGDASNAPKPSALMG